MKSTVQHEPGTVVRFVMPRTDERAFGLDAPTGVLGKRPPMVMPDGIRYGTEVIDAMVHQGDLILTLLVGEPE